MNAEVDYVGLYELLKGCAEITPTGFVGEVGDTLFYEISYQRKGRQYSAWCCPVGDDWRFALPGETSYLKTNVL